MNKLKTKTACLLLFLIPACQGENKNRSKNSDPELYQASELALVMRSMDAEFKAIRSFLAEGKLPSDTTVAHNKMHTARPTNPDEIGEPFYRMALAFSSQVRNMQESKSHSEYINTFNTSIDMCISCHSQYCLGPIDRIKKLKLTGN